MKILSIIGSPRIRGNTHFLAQQFGEGARNAGAEVEEVLLRKLKVGFCTDCDRCDRDGICKINDDFGAIAEKMRACDGIVLSTPVYCCSVTAQMKAFMDRTHSLVYPNWESGLEGKPVALIVGAGYPPPAVPTESFQVNHKARPETLIRMVKELKLVERPSNIRDVLDAMKPFDPTVDTLKILYQFTVFLGMQVLGYIEAVGLGHKKNAVRSRPEEVEKAVAFGTSFTTMVRLIKEGTLL